LNRQKPETLDALMVNPRCRVVIERVSPEVDDGRFPVKRIAGDWVTVTADIFTDGHDTLSAVVQYWNADEHTGDCHEVRMRELGNDRWSGRFQVKTVGRFYCTIQAWIDRFGSWRRDVAKKSEAAQVTQVDLLVGAALVDEASKRAKEADAAALASKAHELRNLSPAAVDHHGILEDGLAEMVWKYSDRRFAATYEKVLVVVTDREKARFSAWYEMFPRSASAEAGRHGTFKDCEARLPYLAEMGFDVLYLSPIHPIGRSHRKGKNNATTAERDDVGSPWAIGASEGGHAEFTQRVVGAQTYAIPLSEALTTKVRWLQQPAVPSSPPHVDVEDPEGDGILTLVDAVWDESFLVALLDAIGRGQVFRGRAGELRDIPTVAFKRLRGKANAYLGPSIMKAEQSNTSIVYGGRLILKLFRRVAEGANPEVEVCSFLTERTSFAYSPAVAGTLEYRQAEKEPVSLAVLQAFVPNQGDAWKYTLRALGDYFDRVATYGVDTIELLTKPLLALAHEDSPPAAAERIGAYLESARKLGERTAELHVALASGVRDAAFSPEPFSTAYQQSVYESMVTLAAQNLALLRRRSQHLPREAQEVARAVLNREEEVVARFRGLLSQHLTGVRTRVHGDYHLGQVLYTGTDFVIIDFEGEPDRSRSVESSAPRCGMLPV